MDSGRMPLQVSIAKAVWREEQVFPGAATELAAARLGEVAKETLSLASRLAAAARRLTLG